MMDILFEIISQIAARVYSKEADTAKARKL